ncbi:class I adenylate-forming enzyme family protein [Microbaculum marinum]|uniref:Class I adenylate-forming enzyme family protein n=1 Tax=Microbaculum marinum TaxID=1764581 RepID=A0AAW9RPK0_9HYPH
MDRPSRFGGQNLLTRLTDGLLKQFYGSGVWKDETIYDRAAARAEASAEKVAIRDSSAALTYGELLDLAAGIAADLHASGLRPGDRVAAWMSSRVELAPLLLACSRQGYVLCPSLHRNHTVDEIATLLERSTARALYAEAGYGADADRKDVFARAGELGHVQKICRLDAPRPRSAADIARALGAAQKSDPDASGKDASIPDAEDWPDDVVYLAFTSGTTGEPKGVMHSNNTLLSNARALAADWSFGPQSVTYTLSPLSHNLGFGALVLTLQAGGEIVLHDLPRGASLLTRLRETGTTFVFGVPAHAMDLLAEIEAQGGANLPALRGFRISGAAAPSAVVERLLSYDIIPQSGYGMTEACSHHYTLPGDPPEKIVATSGRVCPGYEVRIFCAEDQDKELPVGEIGQIGGRGGSLMLGYFDDQANTEKSFNRDGWFMTGDLGRLDADGYLQITGRIKDVIIRGGHNIHPATIEALAMRHPAVERAAAVPVKDERLGERVCIVVMPKKGETVEPLGLLGHLHDEGLSKYDMPEYFLQVDEIPLGASGKVLKRALMPSIESGELQPEPIRWKSAAE